MQQGFRRIRILYCYNFGSITDCSINWCTNYFFIHLVGSSGMIASIIGVVIVGSKGYRCDEASESFILCFRKLLHALNYVFITQFIEQNLQHMLFGTTVIGVILVPVIKKSLTNILVTTWPYRNCRLCKMGIRIINVDGNHQRYAINWTIYDCTSCSNYHFL